MTVKIAWFYTPKDSGKRYGTQITREEECEEFVICQDKRSIFDACKQSAKILRGLADKFDKLAEKQK